MSSTQFTSLGLSEPLLRAVTVLGYATPTLVQLQAIPPILAGRDVLAAAQTGTGKTAGFTLPVLQRLSAGVRPRGNYVRALILTPTRELALQVAESVASYGQFLPLKSTVVYGGVKINPQMMKLRGGVDILIATPGRLIDLCRQNAVQLSNVEILVLDEADRMLDLGFSDELGQILSQMPVKRQNLLFSATFSAQIRTLTDAVLVRPVRIEVSPRNTTATSVKQLVYEVDSARKSALLSYLIDREDWRQVLIFTRTKKRADALAHQLAADGIATAVLHGDKSQRERSRAMGCFKGNRVRVLVATDVAARGIDINELPYVVNFDLPKIAEDYIHRIGRTGRAGCAGLGISLVCSAEAPLLSAVESLIGQLLPRTVIAGFEPQQPVPASVLRTLSVKKIKKPKRPKTPQQELDKKLSQARQRSSAKKQSAKSPGRNGATATKGRSAARRGGAILDSTTTKSTSAEHGKKRRDGQSSPAKKRSTGKFSHAAANRGTDERRR